MTTVSLCGSAAGDYRYHPLPHELSPWGMFLAADPWCRR